jgi:hypothetical protein
MEAVRGEMPDSGSGGFGGGLKGGRGGRGGGGGPIDGSTGWAAPHWRQYAWVSPTWFPHWLQKGIYLSLRYVSRFCSGKDVLARRSTRPC